MNYNFETMTVGEFRSAAKLLMLARDAAEREFYDFLAEAENHPRLWEGTGQTFLQFIEREGLVRDRYDVSRFSSYRKCVGILPPDIVENAPVKILAHAGKLKTAEDMMEVIERAQTCAKSNGTITDSQAQRIVKEQQTVRAAVRSNNKSYSALVNENEQLRKKVANLEEENALLRVEVKKLRGGGTDDAIARSDAAA